MTDNVIQLVPLDELDANVTAIAIDKFLETLLPPREMIVKPWLPKGGLAMLYGPRGLV